MIIRICLQTRMEFYDSLYKRQATDSFPLHSEANTCSISANSSRCIMQIVHLVSRWLLLVTTCPWAIFPSWASAGVSDLRAPALYLDLSPSPYLNRPLPPEGKDQDGAPASRILSPLGADSEYVFTRETYSATLICNATYPITWVFHNTEVKLKLTFQLRTKRTIFLHFLQQNGHASWLISLRMR